MWKAHLFVGITTSEDVKKIDAQFAGKTSCGRLALNNKNSRKNSVALINIIADQFKARREENRQMFMLCFPRNLSRLSSGIRNKMNLILFFLLLIPNRYINA